MIARESKMLLFLERRTNSEACEKVILGYFVALVVLRGACRLMVDRSDK